MKNLIFYLLLFVTLAFCCCEEPEDIIGDSYLEVVNQCDYNIKIYFNNSFIGKVDSEKSDTWSVPSGNHTIEGKCTFAEDYRATHNFREGKTTIVTLEIVNKYLSEIKLNSPEVD